jgi:membrane-associated protease RseP (regulator of RpoE activity)
MNALLVILGLALLFYFMHRMHRQVGGCHDRHDHGGGHHAPAPEDTAGLQGAQPNAKAPSGPSLASLLLVTLILLLPLMLLHGAAPVGSPLHPLLFWVILLLPFLVIPFLRAAGRLPSAKEAMEKLEAERESQEAEWRQQRLQVVGPLGERVSREMEIETTRYEGDWVIFEGRLRGDAEAAYERLARSFAEVGRSPRLLEGESGRAQVVAAPISPEEAKPAHQNLAVPLLLVAATLATTTWAGALQQGVNLWQEPGRFAVGLPYSLAIMAILLIHELGHYVAGRLHGIKVTLPYFIPVPMGLGTFGAFIQIRGAIPDRRKLFDVGVAGPLAGLVIALPALYFGLQGTMATSSGPGVTLSGSVLLAWLYGLANGGPVRPDHVVALTPLGFAGWLGLLVTALNLMPVGQLDGGHVAYALFGRRRAETLGWVAIFLLLALGIFYWSGWFTWAILIFFLGGVKHEPALNELPEPGWRRRAVGALAFVLLFLIMAPVPHRFMTAVGIICPYL